MHIRRAHSAEYTGQNWSENLCKLVTDFMFPRKQWKVEVCFKSLKNVHSLNTRNKYAIKPNDFDPNSK